MTKALKAARAARERAPASHTERAAGAAAAPPDYGLGFVDRPAAGWQPKLEVGSVDDPLEREADRLAATIMRMPAGVPPVAVSPAPGGGPIRRCPGGCPPGGCGRHGKLLRAAERSGPVPAPTAGEVAAASRGGTPLPPASRSFFEPRFGRSFDGVRVHTGPAAAGISQRVSARAFTLGRDIYFGPGQWAPGTSGGDRLLAHELAHVAQGGARTLRRESGGAAPACPTYEPGEQRQSNTSPGVLPDDVTRQGAGYVLVADFPVGSAQLSTGVAGDPDFQAWLATEAADPAVRLELIGYSDCVGAIETNESLRRARVAALRAVLPAEVAAKVVAETAAPLGAYVGPNDTREGRARNRGVVIRYQRIREPPPPPEPEPEPTPIGEPEPPAPGQPPCPSFEETVRDLLLVDPGTVADIVGCLCFAGGVLDLFDFVPFLAPATPVIEAIDCACNVYTLLQEIYARGSDTGCFAVGNLSVGDVTALVGLAALVGADCFSLPLGAGLGALLAGTGGGAGGAVAGSPGGPPGAAAGGILGGLISAAAGLAIGNFIVDVGAMALQNLITQGTPLPINQCRACLGAGRALGLPFTPDSCGTPPGRPLQ